MNQGQFTQGGAQKSRPKGTFKKVVRKDFKSPSQAKPQVEEKDVLPGIKSAFDRWDANGDGTIDRGEVGKVLGLIMRGPDGQPTQASEEEITSLINTMDLDHNGKIEWSEFKTCYLRKYGVANFERPDRPLTDMERDFQSKK